MKLYMSTQTQRPPNPTPATKSLLSPPTGPLFIARFAPLAVGGWYIVDPKPLDATVANAFDIFMDSPASHACMTEAVVASGAFVFWIALFSLYSYRRTGDEAAISWTKLENASEWFNPLASYLISIFLYHQIHPHPAMPQESISFSHLAIEVATGIFLYDVLMYPLHYLMHNFGPMKKFHHYHHRSSVVHPVETVQHSYVDGVLQVVVNVLVQQVTPFGGQKHILSRLAHNVLITYLLTESHVSAEPPWASYKLWPELFSGRHRKHHEGGGGGYQQFGCWIDDLFIKS